jgi:hypothetical protein
MKKRLSIHSIAPRVLERRISEHPHFKHTIGFMAASLRALLPAMVGRHNRFKENPNRRSDLQSEREHRLLDLRLGLTH